MEAAAPPPYLAPGRDLRLDFFFVQLGQQLALLDFIAIVHQQFLDDSAGLRLHLNLGDRSNFAGSDHALGQIALFHLLQLRRVNLGAAAGGRDQSSGDQEDKQESDAAVD